MKFHQRPAQKEKPLLHYDSLLAHLLDKDKFPRFLKRIFEAVDDDWTLASVLWPAKWPLEALKDKEADIGPTEFNQEWRNRPVNSDSQSFKEADIIRHQYKRESLEGKQLISLTGIDPAISKKEKADDFGSVTVKLDEQGFIYVWRSEGKHLSFPEQVGFINARYDEEHPEAIGVESVAYQKALKQQLDEESRKSGRYIPVVEITADTDKFRRITTLAPLVENGTIRFCLDGTQKKLVSQLLFLGKIKDDLADALHIAVALARSRCFKAVMGTVQAEESWYGSRDRGMLTRAAQQQISRFSQQPEAPVLARSQRRSVWD